MWCVSYKIMVSVCRFCTLCWISHGCQLLSFQWGLLAESIWRVQQIYSWNAIKSAIISWWFFFFFLSTINGPSWLKNKIREASPISMTEHPLDDAELPGTWIVVGWHLTCSIHTFVNYNQTRQQMTRWSCLWNQGSLRWQPTQETSEGITKMKELAKLFSRVYSQILYTREAWHKKGAVYSRH